MQIAKIEAYLWDILMRAPYRSAQRTTTVAHNVLVVLTLADGTTGYGESSPAAYVTGETQASVHRAVNLAAPRLVGRDATDATEIISEHLVAIPGAISALEIALYDAMAHTAGMPLYQLMGGDSRITPERVTDLSLPLLPPREAGERASQAAADGFTTIKLKIGSTHRQDIERVRAVAAAAPNVKLRLDGNQAFSPEEAVRLIEDLADLTPRIELFEQPTRAEDEAALGFVQQRIPFPVFADESCHNQEDARRMIGEGICRGVVLKLAKSGLTGAYAIAQTVAAGGGKCLFGCMMETRVGIAAALHLTLALGPKVVPLLDLDGHLLVNDEAVVNGGPRQDGERLIADASAPGLGLTVLI